MWLLHISHEPPADNYQKGFIKITFPLFSANTSSGMLVNWATARRKTIWRQPREWKGDEDSQACVCRTWLPVLLTSSWVLAFAITCQSIGEFPVFSILLLPSFHSLWNIIYQRGSYLPLLYTNINTGPHAFCTYRPQGLRWFLNITLWNALFYVPHQKHRGYGIKKIEFEDH